MKTKIERTMKIFIAMIVTIALGVTFGLITASAAENDDIMVIKMEEYTPYIFSPIGYTTYYPETTTEHTGTYVLIGSAREDVKFTSDDDGEVTYNVILHSLDAVAKDWYGMFSIDPGVTLNLTIYGSVEIKGYNHPGIGFSGDTGESNLNITVGENSSLTVGSRYHETFITISEGINVTLNEEATSSLDLTNDDWRSAKTVVFSRGTEESHETCYFYLDDNSCGYGCMECELFSPFIESHYTSSSMLEEENEQFTTHHISVCYNCSHVFDSVPHEIDYTSDSKTHTEYCYRCDYEGTAEPHTLNETGCSVCLKEFTVRYKVNGETKYAFELSDAADEISEFGGEITLLAGNLTYGSTEISSYGGNVTLDLNGFSYYGIYFTVNSGCTVSIIDSSEEKTGLWYPGSDTTTVFGTLILDGIAMRNVMISANNGEITMQNVISDDSVSITTDSSSVEITNAKFQLLEMRYYDVSDFESFNVNSGTFNKINVGGAGSSSDGTVGLLPPSGYAFASIDGILDANKTSVLGITAVIEHSEHNQTHYKTSSTEHWATCTCGYNESTEKSPHTLGEGSLCSVCSARIAAELSYGDTVAYYLDFADAVLAANKHESATIKILSNSTFDGPRVHGDITIDLNGKHLVKDYGSIHIYGKLTFIDTSSAKTGKVMCKLDEEGYLMRLYDGSSLTIDNGEFFGWIYTEVYGDNASASIEVNGGKFTSNELFRLTKGTTITVNGGVFMCSESVFDTIWASVGAVNYVINGGTFINSCVFYYCDDPTELEPYFGSTDKCKITVASFNDENVSLATLTSYYEGEIYVVHENSVGVVSSNYHYLMCNTCFAKTEKISHTQGYTVNENDTAQHVIFCVVCDFKLGTASHSGGEATCTEPEACEFCGESYGDEPLGHSFDNDCDAGCNACDYERSVPDHVYENACDKICNVCKDSRDVPDHVYENSCDVDCNECRLVREIKHTYDNGCDTECNVCKLPKSIRHIYDNDCDSECNECGAPRTVSHSYKKNVCTACGAENPNPKTNRGIWIALLVVAICTVTVAILGGGAVAVLIIVNKKRA